MADINDVTLGQLVNSITTQSQKLTDYVDGQEKINTALVDKLDSIAKTLPTSKTITNLDTKIKDLGTSSSKTEQQLGKLNMTLGGVERLIKSSNELTSKQTKIIENLDPGSRRLKGDTYDAETLSKRTSEKGIAKAIRQSQSFIMRNPITTAGVGAFLYKPLSWMWRNKLPIAAGSLLGLMDPRVLTGEIGFREGLLGDQSWMRKRFGDPGGGGVMNWMMDNPGWTLGGAAALGTGTGRALLGGTAKLGALGLYHGGRLAGGAAGWAYGGGMSRMINAPSRFVGARDMMNRVNPMRGSLPPTPTTPRSPGATGRLKADSFKNIAKTLKGGPVQRTYLQATKDAAKRGFTRGMAKRIGTLAAARVLQGLALAGGTAGLGTPVTIALWGATIAEIANIIAEPIGEWWQDSHAEKIIAGRDLLQEKAILAKEAGIKITDAEGRFLSPEQVTAQNQFRAKKITGGGVRNRSARQREMGRIRDLKSKRDDWLKTLRDDNVRIFRQEDAVKRQLAAKIVAISDGTQFIGSKWTKQSLMAGASTTELFGLYWDVVLPRATGAKAQDARNKAGVEGKAVRTETGMAVKGSRAEISKRRLKEIEDRGKTPEELKKEQAAKAEAEKKAQQRKEFEIGLGGALTLQDWQEEGARTRAQMSEAIQVQKEWVPTYTKEQLKQKERDDRLYLEFKKFNDRYMEFLASPQGQAPGAAHEWLQRNPHPSISEGINDGRDSRLDDARNRRRMN